MKPLPLHRWGRWLLWSFPILAFFFRRRGLRQLLRHIDHPEVPTQLVLALASTDAVVARDARAALATTAPPEHAVPALAAALGDEVAGLVNHAREVLLALAAPRAVPVLIRCLAGARGTVERGIRQSLCWPQWLPVSVPALAAASAANAPAASAAASILAGLPPVTAVPLLAAALVGSDAQAASGARKALDAVAANQLVSLLAGLFGQSGTPGARGANQYLRTVTSPAAIDALINHVLDNTGTNHLLPLLAEAKYRHSDEGRHFLLLALAGRFDEYLAADFEFSRLRQEYRASPPALQQRIREAITRAGDVRMNGLFVVERKATTLGDLSAEEAEMLVQINARNKNWDKLFTFLDILPARSIASAVSAMQAARWRPADEDKAVLFARLTAIAGQIGDAPKQARAGVPISQPMRLWLDRGETGEYSKLAEKDLRSKLNDETKYSDRISAMAALKKMGKLTAADLESGAKSDQWLVRIATTILGGPPPAPEPGGSLWIERLAPVLDAEAVWGGKPFLVTRDGLEALQEGLSRMPDRKAAGGLLLLEAVASHYMAHDIEVDVGAHVTISEDAIEIEG